MPDPAETPPATAVPPRQSLWILMILGLAVALRLPGYTESIWLDELYTSNIFCGDPVVLLKTLYSDIHPPAYFVFIHFWNAIFGDSEIWLRLPPLLCGLGSIVLIWRLGILFAGPTAGLMAAFLLCVSPVHIWYSQEARPYSTNIFMLLLCTLSFYRLLLGPRRWGWTLLYFASLGCVVFTHYYLAAFPVVFGFLALIRKTPNRGRILVSGVLVLGLLGAYVAVKMYVSEVPTKMHYLRAFDAFEAWRLGFAWFLTGDTLDPLDAPSAIGGRILLVLQVLAVAAFLRGLWRLGTSKPNTDAPAGLHLVVHLLVLPACLFGLTLIGLDQTYIERSALPSLPFFVLILAVGLTGWRHVVTGRSIAVLATIAAVVVVSAHFIHREHWTIYKPNPDWRGAATLLGEDLDRTTDRKILFSDYVSPTGLTYDDSRIQEAKRFEPNDRKIRKVLDKTVQLFDEEKSPGKHIHAAILGRLEAYNALLANDEKDMRLAVYELAKHDPLDRARIPREFWLLIHRDPTERATRLIADPRATVVAEASFRQLKLYKLRCDE